MLSSTFTSPNQVTDFTNIGIQIGTDGTAYGDFITSNQPQSSLYTLNLTTGAATLVGSFNLPAGENMFQIAVAPVASSLNIIAPNSIQSYLTGGNTFQFTLQALDQNGNLVAGYAGNVGFSSSGNLGLPSSYQFIPGDTAPGNDGSQTFSVTLNHVGIQTITVVDLSNPGTPAFTFVVANLYGWRAVSYTP